MILDGWRQEPERLDAIPGLLHTGKHGHGAGAWLVGASQLFLSFSFIVLLSCINTYAHMYSMYILLLTVPRQCLLVCLDEPARLGAR